MARVTLAGDTLTVEAHGLDKLWSLRPGLVSARLRVMAMPAGPGKVWSLKSRLEIPLEHLRGATADPVIAREHHGSPGPGTCPPGGLPAGAFRHDGDRVFWDVANPARAVVLELAGERFTRLVVEVDDPEATAAAIGKAISSRIW